MADETVTAELKYVSPVYHAAVVAKLQYERDEAVAKVRGAKAVIFALVRKLGGGAPVHLDYGDILAAASVTLDVVEESGGYTYRAAPAPRKAGGSDVEK